MRIRIRPAFPLWSIDRFVLQDEFRRYDASSGLAYRHHDKLQVHNLSIPMRSSLVRMRSSLVMLLHYVDAHYVNVNIRVCY